jgi:hypothetical protein
MIEFHIHQKPDPSWQVLADYIANIWPKENLCIVANPQDIDTIENAIWSTKDRFIPISQTHQLPGIIYLSSQAPPKDYWVINTSTLQLPNVNLEWVTNLPKGRERYKHWQTSGLEIQVVKL